MSGRSVDVSGRSVSVNGRSVGGGGAIPDSGLLHRWNLSDTSYPIVDPKGTNNFTQGKGGTFDTTSATFRDGVGYATDGSDDYAEAENTIDEFEFTISLWTYPQYSSSSLDSFVFATGDGGGNTDSWPLIGPAGVGGETNPYGEWRGIINDSGGTSYTVVSSNAIQTETLQHVALRYDGSTLSLVEGDGNEVDTTPASLTESDRPTPKRPRIGEREDGFNYDGITDSILYYNRSLSLSELSDIYDSHPST